MPIVNKSLITPSFGTKCILGTNILNRTIYRTVTCQKVTTYESGVKHPINPIPVVSNLFTQIQLPLWGSVFCDVCTKGPVGFFKGFVYIKIRANFIPDAQGKGRAFLAHGLLS